MINQQGSCLTVANEPGWISLRPFAERDKVLEKGTIESRSGPLPYMIKIEDAMVSGDMMITSSNDMTCLPYKREWWPTLVSCARLVNTVLRRRGTKRRVSEEASSNKEESNTEFRTRSPQHKRNPKCVTVWTFVSVSTLRNYERWVSLEGTVYEQGWKTLRWHMAASQKFACRSSNNFSSVQTDKHG